METIYIKYFNNKIPHLKKIDKGDWIDLYSAETVELKKGDSYLIHLGVAMQLPEGYEAHVLARSSTFKTWGIMLTNAMGMIDESYCGDGDEWRLPVIAMRDTTIHEGDRICQFRITEKQPAITFEVKEKLDNPDRSGFGSTGAN